MRIRPDESYESWAQRVQEFELAQAKKELAQGADINLVMEAMSARMQQKLLHPILKAIRDTPTNYNAEEGRKRYYEAMKGKGPASDHVLEEKDV